MTKTAVLGLWHLGLVSAACLSEMGFQVTGFDRNGERNRELHEGKLPLFEPGLEEAIQASVKNKTLSFASKPEEAVSDASVVLLTYDTPVDEQDKVDLSVLDETMTMILPFLKEDALIVINSQVPVGSCEKWQSRIDAVRPESGIDVVCSPENLRLGQALQLFRKPDMIVAGCHRPEAVIKMESFLKPFDAPKFFVSWRTAEMTKHAINAFLATSISFANEIGNLCDALGADGMEIAKILKSDSRIGNKAQVRPGLGFAGATLARDITGLKDLGKKFGVQTQLMDSVLDINRRQTHVVYDLLEQCFEEGLKGKNIAILGLTYKPGTSTLRRSTSLEIIRELHSQGCRVQAHDPKADLSEMTEEQVFTFCEDPYQAALNADALLLLTEWPEYREIDFSKIKNEMSGQVLLDAKSHLDGPQLKSLGFQYIEIGRGQMAAVKS